MGASSPIRVCQVVGKMRAGGVESFLMNYYRHIDRDRIQFDFVIDEDSPNHELVPEIESLGGRVFEVPRYQDLPRYLPTLEKLFREQRWPIVHSQINALSVFPLMAAKRAGIPVRIAHSHTALAPGEPVRNAAKRFLRQFANIYPTHKAACGTDAGKWLFGSNAEFTVIPNAIELEKFAFDPVARRAVRNEFGVSDRDIVLGHIGRFMTQKNHGFLVDVFAEIAKVDSTATLVLAGEGPLENAVREKVDALGITRQVRFLGQRTDPERLYSAFDVFVLPSLYEGFPVVAVEAQASGLPCVVADSVTKECGLLNTTMFLPCGVGTRRWAEACMDLAGGSKRANRYEEASLECYDIEGAVSRTCGFYCSVLGMQR